MVLIIREIRKKSSDILKHWDEDINDLQTTLKKCRPYCKNGVNMNWFYSIIRVAGASFPGASSLVQLQAEIDSKVLDDRISKLEDPISNLHSDVPDLSRNIYRNLKTYNSAYLDFDEDFHKKYSRALAELESKCYIRRSDAIGKNCAPKIRILNPLYIMYLCKLEEDSKKMESLIKLVDECKAGESLDGNNIQMSIDLPLPVIKAAFEIYESKGYGLCSKTVGSCKYYVPKL
jgi:hypothetical protein